MFLLQINDDSGGNGEENADTWDKDIKSKVIS